MSDSHQLTVARTVIKELRGKINKNHRVIKILAPTGYGKTTIIPITITTSILTGERMIVLFPNVTAVRKMYEYLSDISQSMEGELRVGFAAASEIKYGPEHNLVLATYGHGYRLALNSMRMYVRKLNGYKVRINEQGLLQFNSVVFDEYHNVAKEVPLVASIYRLLMNTMDQSDRSKRASTRQHRAFFMTATDIHQLPGGMDTFVGKSMIIVTLGSDSESRYASVFRPPTGVNINNPKISIPTKLAMGRVNLKGNNLLLTKILNGVVEALNEVTSYTGKVVPVSSGLASILKSHGGKPTKTSLPSELNGQPISYNNVLVFLPGKKEIQYVHDRMNKNPTIEVIEFHSKSPNEDVKRLVNPPLEGIKRIILATNIVESSVTIDYLDVVIDSLLEKTVVNNVELGAKQLVLQYISRNSSQQRCGRVGRNRVGVAIRIASEGDYSKLLQSKDNSIVTENVSKVLSEVLATSGQANTVDILDNAGVGRERRAEAMVEATSLGVYGTSGGSYTLNIGRADLDLIGRMPLNLQSSVFLFRWLEKKYPPYPGIIMAVIWDMNSQYVDANDNADQVNDMLEELNLKHSTLIGQSINLWKYAVSQVGTIQLSEYHIRRLFTRGGIQLVDEAEFKRLSNSIYECVRTISSFMKIGISQRHKELMTQRDMYKQENDLNRVKELNVEIKNLALSHKKPIAIAEFSTDDAIRALGFISQTKLGLDKIGHITKTAHGAIINDGKLDYHINKSVANKISSGSRSTDREYLILGTFVVGERKIATNIIPTYSEMDRLSKLRRPARVNVKSSRRPIFSDDEEEEPMSRTRNDGDEEESEEFNPRRPPTSRLPLYKEESEEEITKDPVITKRNTPSREPEYSTSEEEQSEDELSDF